MSEKCIEFIKWTKENNWDVTEKIEYSLMLEAEVSSRYKEIPNEYLEFLTMIKQLISPNEKTWFICENEYNNKSDIAFRWNEFEELSLEAADDDDEWKMEITSWWDKHLPIVMSVDEGYLFYAIDLDIDKGSIVKGYEPEFEEVEKVANNIEEFFNLIMLNEIKIH